MSKIGENRDYIDKILDSAKPRVSKSNRTLSLDKANFEAFQKECNDRGLVVSVVVDGFIFDFLKRIDERQKNDGKL